ncbi:MAG TPA: glycosyltransferase [Syntrophobacteria bacterium]|nr:glycosyltransferase [Syntrophobacteria bacterium]
MDAAAKPKIAVLVSFSGEGGVERLMLNLCEGLLDLGLPVDLLAIKRKSAHLKASPRGLNIVPLRATHTYGSLPEVVRYLRTERPRALLAVKDRANQVAILAGRFARTYTRIAVEIQTTISAALRGKSSLRKAAWYLPMRLLYPMADVVIAVSEGVARDLVEITGVPRQRIQVIRNPAVSGAMFRLAQEPVDHPWYRDRSTPIITGIGRLTRQKDFPTLIRAFAQVRSQVPCRLVILGEGRDRAMLSELAHSLGVAADIALPGFVVNPYPFLRGASLFVLSSVWEGSPTVLTEAMALGVPVVATDCPSGPREILRGGEIAPVVPMGDPDALAAAMLDTLARRPDGVALQKAVVDYTVAESSRRYAEVLLGRACPTAP